MQKVIYHTADIFSHSNTATKRKWLDRCYKIAVKCGLTCRKVVEENRDLVLDMHGSKLAFVKYYLMTFEHPGCIAHLKRIMQIITM